MSKRKILSKKFFNRPTLIVAKELLGKYLVRTQHSLIRANKRVLRRHKTEAFMITEVEAYDGFKDKASHARHGKEKRGKLMFGPPGVWYVYFTYGMHFMLNVTTREEGYPGAVLIRGVEGINGPGRVTKALGIAKELNGKIANRKTGLWIEDRRAIKKNNKYSIINSQGKKEIYRVIKTPRIGIDHAGPVWKNKKLRFVLKEKKKK